MMDTVVLIMLHSIIDTRCSIISCGIWITNDMHCITMIYVQ